MEWVNWAIFLTCFKNSTKNFKFIQHSPQEFNFCKSPAQQTFSVRSYRYFWFRLRKRKSYLKAMMHFQLWSDRKTRKTFNRFHFFYTIFVSVAIKQIMFWAYPFHPLGKYWKFKLDTFFTIIQKHIEFSMLMRMFVENWEK